MTLTLNVLNHLGLNLYSSLPAVAAEVVANSYDADAEHVWIKIAKDPEQISITDDGEGMNEDDVNDKYLTVGYERRLKPETKITPKWKRPVMGRKGIGKLSLFSVAEIIEVYTVKSGQRNAFRMVVGDIREKIKTGEGAYSPEVISDWPEDLTKGTRIVLKELKKSFRAEAALRRRLARRFSIIGAEHHFEVSIDGSPITIADREYFGKVQFIWYFGKESRKYAEYCTKTKNAFQRPNGIVVGTEEFTVEGWIGTVEKSTQLKDAYDNLNKIVLMVRGKLAEEDLMENFTEGGVYTKYLFGEINANFLDIDEKADISTTSRQKIIEDDPRYNQLLQFVYAELKNVENTWTRLRNEEGVEKAVVYPAVKEWFDGLKGERKRRAEALLGKINQITIDSDDERRTLLKHSILAFESLSYKENLDALDSISPDNLKKFTEVAGQLDDIEATLYHQIVSERLRVIEALRQKVEEDVLEKLIQQYVFDHLWLLDPAWDRATENAYMESSVLKEFKQVDAGLPAAEKRARLDITYKMSTGKHIIIELKRASASVTTPALMDQVGKYRRALQKVLDATRSEELIEVICILGKPPSDWTSQRERRDLERALKEIDTRVVLYGELIKNASQAYSAYADKHKGLGTVMKVIKALETV